MQMWNLPRRSFFPFILSLAVYSRILNNAASSNFFSSLGISRLPGGMKNFQFTDDILLFSSMDKDSLMALKFILYYFELIFGLSMNFWKIIIAPIGKVSNQVLQYAPWLNCNSFSLSIYYLGLPLKDSKLTKSDWMPLLLKIEGRLAAWVSKFLSFGGRLVLVYAVLFSIPINIHVFVQDAFLTYQEYWSNLVFLSLKRNQNVG